MIFPDLDARCPGSKFILTTRGLDGWLDSMAWMLKHGRRLWYYGPHVDNYHMAFYGTKKFDAAVLREKWALYHAHVNVYFQDRPSDLLTVDLDQGWNLEQMRSFLGSDDRAIDVSFHINAKRKVSIIQSLRYFKWRVTKGWLRKQGLHES
jgi:hypothetical protein